MKNSLSIKEIWGAPVAMGLLGVAGLSAALFGDGFWDVVSWVALAVPTLASFWYLLPYEISSESTDGR